jgi:ParB-like chromosome segregation protein Spo0J
MPAPVDQPLAVTRVLMETLRPHPENPREGNVEAIAESLSVNGQYRPLVVQAGSGVIVAGNHTWKAARSLGWEWIDVVLLDIDDHQARRILLADNRLADLAHYDNASLLAVLQGLGTDLDGTGYSAVSVEDLAKLLAPPPSVADLVRDTEEPDPSDFYPVVKVALPPPDFDRWRQWRAGYGDDDTTAFCALLDTVDGDDD